MKHAAHHIIATLAAGLYLACCGIGQGGDRPPEQPKARCRADMGISVDAAWEISLFNNQPEHCLNVSLIARGVDAAGASACGDLEVDAIKDENGQSVKAPLTFLAGMLLVDRTERFSKHPKDGVRIGFDLQSPPPLRKLSELRGSFALQTCGRMEEVVLKDAIKETSHTIDDAILKSRGVTVRVTRTTRQPPSHAVRKLATSTTPGEMEDAQDELNFDVTTAENAVVRFEITDPNGKPFVPMAAEFGKSITKVKYCFEEKLPASSQLRLTIHRDATTMRVPFALKNIDIPAEKTSEANLANGLTPVLPGSNRTPDARPNTAAPIQLGPAR